MTTGANIDELVQDVVEAVPDELQADLRNWISRARSGALAEIEYHLSCEARAAWTLFENASQRVEEKLQE